MKHSRAIIVSIPLVWGIRNFVLSGISKTLEEKFDVFYAIPEVGKPYMLKAGISEDKLIILRSQKYTAFQRWSSKILHKSHRKRFPTASDQVFKSFVEPKKKGIKDIFVSFASYIFRLPFFYTLLEHFDQFLYLRRVDEGLVKRIQSINPILAISTSYVVNTEWSLFRLLADCEVEIHTHILSFDNLTSRGYLPIKYFDRFMVWNDKMASELRAIYRIPNERIIITGTPQFDFHVHPQYLQSHQWTSTRLGIRNAPYILYCANHFALTPDEPKLFEEIALAFKADSILKSYQLVLRLHPMDDYDRWNETLSAFPEVRVSYPWPHHNKENIFWGEPSLEDLELFSNTLRYCSLVLNIASTVSIDAAILDRPIVCVGFNADSSEPLNSQYYNFHFSDHYAPIMKTGATPLSTDLESLVAFSTEAILNPDALCELRKQMVRLLCGEADGLASSRIVDCLLNSIVE